jgi:hypothetical protein
VSARPTARRGAAAEATAVALLAAALLAATAPDAAAQRRYVAPQLAAAPVIDGRLDDPAWRAAPWSEDFIDIEGPAKPAPRHRTRVKLAWTDAALVVAAELEEPHLWATLTRRDAVIFHDNDIELFVDPDGDARRYFELEINALNTQWDLFLPVAYRDGGHAVDGFDFAGLRTAVHLDGTLNDPRDTDRGWTVEILIPFTAFRAQDVAHAAPRPGDTWRVNFSRVQWDLDVVDGAYAKARDPATGKPRPEHNWVWSPQGVIDMHQPERWGIVEFVEAGGNR